MIYIKSSNSLHSDTDGLWTDEWDVDMGVYEGQPGDKDAQDSEDMRNSGQFRRFGDVDEKIGDFEKHTKVVSSFNSLQTRRKIKKWLMFVIY